MLGKLLDLLRDDRTRSLYDLARALDTTSEMVETMLENLERMGYVHQVNGCDKACPSCEMASACTQISPGRIWSLHDRGLSEQE